MSNIKKWSNIENCPSGLFYALLKHKKYSFLYKIRKVYIHKDNCFPFWSELRYFKNMKSVVNWKCVYYK